MQTTDLKIKKLSETMPGELVRLSALGRAPRFCIVMEQKRENAILACLEPIAGVVDRPFHFFPSNNLNAVSFGSDWFLDIELDHEFYPGSQSMRWGSGALKLQGTEWVLSIHQMPTAYQLSELFFNLSSNEITEMPAVSTSAPISQWRIWKDREAATLPDGKPLVTVQAVEVN
ncbi:hypothetical protein DSM25558_0191 [Agrobacterium sp. DSM 25558]|uniref:hypothetical protein n=1 Tax=Agrobacterium sp. DSM 25558 TaxID=1907665 RepID=UPI0009724C4C|nr:hypothetical protein [Agrobacterium sp. DSM 25558]SCX00874.1 hypothetical protein DSM25558_0191 [Agrobacterium sp. DSM 25558]